MIPVFDRYGSSDAPAGFLDLTKHLKDLPGLYNAVPGVAGGGDVIRGAIDAWFNDPARWRGLYLPGDLTYYLSDDTPLISTHETTFHNLLLTSRRHTIGSRPGDIGSFSLVGARIAGDCPNTGVFFQQGARGNIFEGITFENLANTAPYDNIVEDDLQAIHTNPELADWVSAGCRTNRYSPCCAFAIDPFIDVPLADGDRYPGLESYYGGDDLATPRPSGETSFYGCHFRGGVVGVASSPAGPGGVGATQVFNNENNTYERCTFKYNAIHYSSGQSQERGNVLVDPRLKGAWLGIDDQYVGEGGQPGVAPVIRGGNAGYLRSIFNLQAAGGSPVSIDSFYAEGCGSIGILGLGSAAQGVITVAKSFFALHDPTGNNQGPAHHLETRGMVTIEGGQISTDGAGLRVWNNQGGTTSGRLTLNGVKFTNDAGSIAPIGFCDGTKLTDSNLQVGSLGFVKASAAVYVEGAKSLITSGEVSSYHYLCTIVQDGTVLSRGTFTVASTTGLAVGQFLCISSGSAVNWLPQRLNEDQSDNACNAPFGRISDITGTTITVDEIPYGFPFGDHWLTWQQLDLSGGSTP